ncbi:MAG: T9SS type A sorting domain-containing protein, partial [Saprospiraceae bacterium]
SKLKAYPNPSPASWTIDNDKSKIHRIEVYNLSGHLLLRNIGGNSTENIDATLLANGVYVARVYDDRGVQVVKLFKN